MADEPPAEPLAPPEAAGGEQVPALEADEEPAAAAQKMNDKVPEPAEGAPEHAGEAPEPVGEAPEPVGEVHEPVEEAPEPAGEAPGPDAMDESELPAVEPEPSAETAQAPAQEAPASDPFPVAEEPATSTQPATDVEEQAATPGEVDASDPFPVAEEPATSTQPATDVEEQAATPGEVDAPKLVQSGSRPASGSTSIPALPLADSGSAGTGPSPRPLSSTRTPRSMRVVETTYEPSQFVLPQDLEQELPADSLNTAHLLSLNARRRNNLAYIDDDTLVMAAGNKVVFLTQPQMTQRYLTGLDGGGVGAVAVHPSRQFFAVAEKCRHRAPNIYIYTYPALSLYKVLKGGTERSYSTLTFNDTGEKLASVGAWPDYLLTLWRWESEAIVLRSKAFSQDVYTVKFSPYFDGNLTTSGTGHIRFWKMAATFTGLKLQGLIGKFGTVELSDVVAFVEMPDGKVLSSTETGELLMWDGGLIKVMLVRPGKKPCHDGPVEVLLHDRSSNTIVTGGADGYVRLWDFNKVNDSEPEEDSHYLAITPVDEVKVCPGGRIRSMVWERRHWIILDGTGALWRVDLPQGGSLSKGAVVSRLLEFHAGGIVGLAASPVAHVAMTAGRDGSLRVFDCAARSLKATLMFNQPAMCFTTVGSDATLAVVGFKDGVIRAVLRLEDGLLLTAAYKPHKGAVTALAVAPDGTRLVTAGEDGTLFFFDIAGPHAITPLCFSQIGGAATCVEWSADATKVLAGMRNSTVLEVDAPQDVDVDRTYETQLAYRTFAIKLPKPKKVKSTKSTSGAAADGSQQAAEGEAPADDAVAEGAAALAEGEAATGGDAVEGEGEAGDKEGSEHAEEADQSHEDEVLEVLTCSYVPGDAASGFRVTMSGYGAGSVWRCTWGEADGETPAEPVPEFKTPTTGPTSFFGYSASGNYQLMGTADGVVRVQPTSSPFGSPEGRYWQACLHDMLDGRVTAVAMSFDESYLLSAAADGTLYLQEAKIEGKSPATPSPSGSESLTTLADAAAPAADITSISEYTIEEAKQKAEQDALVAAAEAKKMGVREQLQQIRAEFEALMAANAAKPEAERLPRSAFEIDVGLREMMEEETARREEEARKEMAWDTEKRRLALAKLKAFYLDGVEVERIVLHALRSKQRVTSFRTARLPEELLVELAEAKAAEAQRVATASSRGSNGMTDEHAEGQQGADDGAGEDNNTSQGAQGSLGGKDTSRHTKADLRRLARKQREAEWVAFNATRPDEKYEAPADVAAIRKAERNMGDFKLKSDPSYVIPEDERMTPQRKRFQMLLLEEAMYNARMDFNNRFLALREVKKKVISEINARVVQLKEINQQLGKQDAAQSEGGRPEQELSELSLKPEEVPENREKVTDADIADFLKRKEEAERKAAGASALGGFAAGGAKGQPPKTPAGAASKAPAHSTGGAAGAKPGDAAAVATAGEDPLSRMMAAVPLSDLERQLQAYHKRKLEHQRSRLRAEVDEMAEAFDSALTALRQEKLRTEADIKLGEMRQLIHAQELALLADFDKREVVLIQKRAAKMEDRADILSKIGEANAKLEAKRVELEGLLARRASVSAEFDNLVPENDPFREPLSKIFHRRIKRIKKKVATGNQDDDGDSEEEEEDEGGDDEDGDDDDEDMGEEVCPPGCDQALYEKVCDLREKRLDEEELIAEFTKTIDALRKDKEAQAKKQKLLEQGLAAINTDITEFQKEKQGALNQIDVVVNLKMHQIEYLVDGRLPDDLSAGLVFSNNQLARLRRRVDELEEEKAALRARHKGLRREHAALLRDKAAKEARVAELERRAHDVQMLKFGQIINLELLDALGASKGTEELKEEVKRQEVAYAKELADWDRKIAARTDELMALTRENTRALNTVSDLTAAQRTLEAGLTTTRKTMFADPVHQRRQEVEERDTLVQLVNAQAQEVERLKAQIMALRRKDTSVYS